MAGNPPEDRAHDRYMHVTPEDTADIEAALSREPQVVEGLARMKEKYGSADSRYERWVDGR